MHLNAISRFLYDPFRSRRAIISHPLKRTDIPNSLTLYHRWIVHFERLVPPENVYQKCTYCMTESVKLQQTNRKALCDWPKKSEEVSRGKLITYSARSIVL